MPRMAAAAMSTMGLAKQPRRGGPEGRAYMASMYASRECLFGVDDIVNWFPL